MQIKKLKHPYSKEDIHDEAVILILGFFDGVHKGHQAVIRRAAQIGQEKNLKTALMTFNRHPSIVYRSFAAENYNYLTLNEEKMQKVKDLGVDYYYEIEFTSDFGNLSPQDFVDQYIVSWQADTVVAGYDYTYGPPDIANMENLPKYAKGRFEIECVAPQMSGESAISSTRIRKNIVTGEIVQANQDLGYTYQTSGFVIHGEGRGRFLGYPTANIFTDPSYQLIPGIGVYAVEIAVKGQIYLGMASVGYNVTFEKLKRPSVEVNIFDFDSEIYGENVYVYWHDYLRGEKKFASVDELIAQLARDEIICREYFKNM